MPCGYHTSHQARGLLLTLARTIRAGTAIAPSEVSYPITIGAFDGNSAPPSASPTQATRYPSWYGSGARSVTGCRQRPIAVAALERPLAADSMLPLPTCSRLMRRGRRSMASIVRLHAILLVDAMPWLPSVVGRSSTRQRSSPCLADRAAVPQISSDFRTVSPRPVAPLIVVPTTAGTGSEASPDAGVHPDALAKQIS